MNGATVGARIMKQTSMQTDKSSRSQEQEAQELMAWCDMRYMNVAGSLYEGEPVNRSQMELKQL
jgi:hypothetical protein